MGHYGLELGRADDTGVAEEFELGADGGEGAVDACFVGHGVKMGWDVAFGLDLMIDECALCLVARIDKSSFKVRRYVR